MRPRPIILYFWEYVDRRADTECWPWMGALDTHGYGVYGKLRRQASRAAWELTHGPIPDGLCVCHTCDNPPCCNPRHLWLGTRRENNEDRTRKGRTASGDANGMRRHPERNVFNQRTIRRLTPVRGERNPNAKLTAEQVAAIRAEYARGGISQQALGDRYGVSQVHIGQIVLYRKWAHQ